MKQLAKYGDRAYALLRIVTGSMFAFHGGVTWCLDRGTGKSPK